MRNTVGIVILVGTFAATVLISSLLFILNCSDWAWRTFVIGIPSWFAWTTADTKVLSSSTSVEFERSFNASFLFLPSWICLNTVISSSISGPSIRSEILTSEASKLSPASIHTLIRSSVSASCALIAPWCDLTLLLRNILGPRSAKTTPTKIGIKKYCVTFISKILIPKNNTIVKMINAILKNLKLDTEICNPAFLSFFAICSFSAFTLALLLWFSLFLLLICQS